MEKELERFRKSLKVQNVAFVIVALIVISFIVLGFMQIVIPVGADEHWASMWNGFISGISTSMVMFMIIGFIFNMRALKNEKHLKKLYIKAHDERAIEISHQAGHLSYWFETLGLILGIIIGGYFNPIVSFICMGCLLYICLVRLGLKLYYNKKL